MTTGFWTDFRRFFSRGLAAILPTLLTIALIAWMIRAIDQYIGQYITAGMQWLAMQVWKVDAETIQRVWATWRLNTIDFILSIVLVYIVGRFVGSIIGRTVWHGLERVLIRLPLIKQVYPSIKQITDFIILNDNKVETSRVVAVEYPRKGIWSLGFVTNSGMKALADATGRELLSVFIPSSPTPMTGYTITVGRDEVIDLPLEYEQALQFTVSGGVVLPSSEMTVQQLLGRDRVRNIASKPTPADSQPQRQAL